MKFKIKPPRVSSEQIIEGAHKLIEEYRSMVGISAMLHNGLRFHDVFDQVIYPNYEIELADRKTPLSK